ncbi:uncharacterized protein FFB14_01314 [Fusarium fujikuroi]|nr:uncharacterized protein FFB14_01314 [Fusarium fujikuroi]
MLTYRQY